MHEIGEKKHCKINGANSGGGVSTTWLYFDLSRKLDSDDACVLLMLGIQANQLTVTVTVTARSDSPHLQPCLVLIARIKSRVCYWLHFICSEPYYLITAGSVMAQYSPPLSPHSYLLSDKMAWPNE